MRNVAVAVLAVSAFLWGAWLATRPLPSRLATGTAAIHPGVMHKTIVERNGPWRIHVVEIDMHHRELDLETVRALDSYLGRETVTSMAARRSTGNRRVLAALNADYFNPATGEVQNNLIAGGVFVKAFTSPGYRPDYVDIPNSQFAVTFDRTLMIDQFIFSGSVLWANGTIAALSGVNVQPRRGGLAVFNFYRPEMSGGDPSGERSELRLTVVRQNGDTLVCVTGGNGNATALQRYDILLAAFSPADGDELRRHRNDDTTKIVLSMRPGNGGIKELFGGWPRIVRDGKSIFDSEDFPENPDSPMFTRRHPRSGIGFSRDSTILFLIVVDGRQDGSVGMSLPEFARLMISLGVYQGLNLDGGGSTSLVVNGQLVNSPSDPTGERPVGSCVLLVADAARAVASSR